MKFFIYSEIFFTLTYLPILAASVPIRISGTSFWFNIKGCELKS